MGRFRTVMAGIGSMAVVGGTGMIIYQNMFMDRHAIRMEKHVQRAKMNINQRPKAPLPTRADQLRSLREDQFDVFVIGGGATGAGCALDAATRGLKTAMVEADDFSSGTSSRSTKLIHGGVRYLQKAIMTFDYEQYKMVEEALHERSNLLAIAPHLSFPLPIMLPIYKLWQVPYYWMGIKAYDFVSGSECLKSSYYLSKERALELFPMLHRDRLKGAIVYYDGSHNDSRMNIALAVTAARQGATIANHVRVKNLIKDENGKICGLILRDELTGEELRTKAKCVINATGPFTDHIRKMDDPSVNPIVCPSSGIHIVLPDYYSPERMGLLDPDTSDGRVLFLLPWQKHTIAGTTDTPCEVTESPSPSEKDIQFILNEVRHYLSPDVEVRRGDVLSAWSGIRPLVKDPHKTDTQSLVRNHVVHVSAGNLVTIAGGKWTTYRTMAKETIDAACKACDLNPKNVSRTDGLLLEGAHYWTPTMYIRLAQDLGLDSEVAIHLAETYGDRAFAVGRLAAPTGQRFPIVGIRLHPEFPYIEAEVRYAVREYAATAIDIIARRLRLSFLNVQAAEEALPRIVEIMAEELKWSSAEKQRQLEDAIKFLKTQMGKDVNRTSRENIPINLTKDEMSKYVKRFNVIDKDKKGYITVTDLTKSMKEHGENISGTELHAILSEIDTNNNGQVELEEYLQIMTAMKHGINIRSDFPELYENFGYTGDKIERSGGGV